MARSSDPESLLEEGTVMKTMMDKEEEKEGEEAKAEAEADCKKKNLISDPPPLMSLNHVSRVCKSVSASTEFYEKVLGFVVTERPQAFDHFDGAWLFNYGIGIHLVQAKDDKHGQGSLPSDPNHLDPMDNHISFQCEDMVEMERRLKEHNVEYIKRTVEDETSIDQLFFNDPDGFMIEICNCEHIKLVPCDQVGNIKLPSNRHHPPIDLTRS